MTALNSALLKEIEGLDFYKDFFAAGIYEDGRELDQQRPHLVRVGLDQNAAGSSYVQYQGCTLSCSVNAKAGYYDPKGCVRIRLDKSNVIDKREFAFCRAILTDLCNRHVLVDPSSLVFETEYQIQLYVTVTINTCDGFLLGATLLAVQAALQNTKFPKTSLETTDMEDLEEKFKQGLAVRKKSTFVFDTNELVSVKLRDRLVYAGFLVFQSEDADESPAFLVDPPADCVQRLRPRFDIILGESGKIYFWQAAAFDDVTPELRSAAFENAQNLLQEGVRLFDQVKKSGRAESEDMQ